MPRSRRRKLSPLAKIRNRIRGAGLSATAFALSRDTVPRPYAAEIADWSAHSLRNGPLRSLRPNNLRGLLSLPPPSPLSLELELIWFVQIMRVHVGSIIAFLTRKSEIEALIVSNPEQALNCLDSLENDLGYSLFALSLRIGLLQLTKGLEAQKEYIQSIKSPTHHPMINFYAYWWGVRAEDALSYEKFDADFHGHLRRWDVQENIRSQLAYLALAELPDSGDEKLLLSASLSTSVFDYYEAFVALATVAIIERRYTAPEFVSAVREAVEVIEDERLKKLLWLAGDSADLDSIPSADSAIRDALLSGNQPAHAIENTNLEELWAAAEQGISGPIDDDPFMKRFKPAARASGLLGTERSKGIGDLNKLGLMLSMTNVGRWIMSAAADQDAGHPIPTGKNQYWRFVFGRGFDSIIIRSLAPQKLAGLRQSSKHGHSITAQYALAERTSGEPSSALIESITTIAAARLRLSSALLQDDVRYVTSFVDDLNRLTGGATHLAVYAGAISRLRHAQIVEAIKYAMTLLQGDRAYVSWLPMTEIANAALTSRTETVGLIETPLLLSIVAESVDESYLPRRAYACEDFLTAHGAQTPTQYIVLHSPPSSPEIIAFLRDVCTPLVLRLSTAYGSERELEEERISVCRELVRLDPSNSDLYETEALDLVRARHIKTAIKTLQGSKLSIDEPALRQWAERSVREDYSRFINLLTSGIAVVDEKFREQLQSILDSGEITTTSLQVPENEAGLLFSRLVTRVVAEFASNPEHGLDCYLSLRIRHGTLSGHMRGPVEHEHLITKRETAQARYLPNEYWRTHFSTQFTPDVIARIDERLASLSEKYDAVVSDLAQTRIQLKREEKPKGWFLLTPSTTTIYLLAGEVTEGLAFDDFVTKCLSLFWVLVEGSNKDIRAALEALKDVVRGLFDEAEEDLRSITNDQLGQLGAALVRGRFGAVQALDRMKDWFTTPTPAATLAYSVEELVQVSVETLKSFHPEFAPEIDLDVGDIPKLAGVLQLFSDIFFIIFENIVRHSGNGRDPRISIAMRIDKGILLTRVENDVVSVSNEQISERINRAKSVIESGGYRSAVRSEGGTGLPKLAKLINYGQSDLPFDFGYSGANRFYVEFGLKAFLFGEDDEPAISESASS